MDDLEKNAVKDVPSRIAILNVSLDGARQTGRANHDARKDILLTFDAYHQVLS